MNQHASAVARHLTDSGYQGVQLHGDDGERIALSFSGENADSVRVVIAFDDDDYEDETVAFRVWNIAKYNEGNVARVLATCNDLNARRRLRGGCAKPKTLNRLSCAKPKALNRERHPDKDIWAMSQSNDCITSLVHAFYLGE